MKRYVAMGLAFLLIPVAAAAQDPSAFAELRLRLNPGDTITVTDPRGVSTRGKVESISRSVLTMKTGNRTRVFPQQDVLEVKQQYRDPVGDGAKRGLLVGMALGLVAGIQASRSPNYVSESPGAPVGGALGGALYGALIGTLVDAMKKTDRTIYRAPATQPCSLCVRRSAGHGVEHFVLSRNSMSNGVRFPRILEMKLWLSKSTQVALQEQLSTQIVLGIVSGDLVPDEKLPSSEELGRRFKVHPNTVRAAYRGLARVGWLEWRRGSGFYVRDRGAEGRPDPIAGLDHLISSFLAAAETRGYSLADIQSRMRDRFPTRPRSVLVIESDPELREILVVEISQHVSVDVEGVAPDACSEKRISPGVLCVALYDHARDVRAALPPEESCIFLRSSSVPKVLAKEKKPQSDVLICVVSRWMTFLRWARTTLTAVGVNATAIELRDGREDGWNRGLAAYSLVVTDSVLARALPSNPRLRVFRVIAEESMEELRERLEH
jgi:GntR family transcriptional regulator